MNASIPQPRQSSPAWLGVAIWLGVFFSPTAYFLLLLLAERFHIPSLPGSLVGLLFFLIPVIALAVCEAVVWSWSKTVGRRIGWMVFTLLAMLLQCGVLFVILRAILVARIAYVQ